MDNTVKKVSSPDDKFTVLLARDNDEWLLINDGSE